MFDAEIEDRAAALVAAAHLAGRRIATAESCTGGLVAAAICAIPGASAVFDRGVVAYANAAKSELLGVETQLIQDHGAVSREVAWAMAKGLNVDLVLSVTGIAGPGGGSLEKPVGTVWFGLKNLDSIHTQMRAYGDLGRQGIQRAALLDGLDLLSEALSA
ncbi:MAG: cinA-like protein [Caulobacteraceae bacterium]|nr:cinA-like protein [Caulobacteraceae bacterium]